MMFSRMGISEPNLASRKQENWHFFPRNIMLSNVLNYFTFYIKPYFFSIVNFEVGQFFVH